MDELVVAVDVQRAFVGDESVANRVASLLAQEIPHVLTRFVNEPDSPFRDRGYDACGPDDPGRRLHGAVKQYRDEAVAVVDKAGYSAFAADRFVTAVETVDPDRTYVCGLETDGCVYATALDLFDRGYGPRIVIDACDTAGGDTARKVVARNVEVVTTASVVEDGK